MFNIFLIEIIIYSFNNNALEKWVNAKAVNVMASAQFFSQRSSKNTWYFCQDKFGRLWWIKQVYNSQDKYQICFADMYFAILQTDFSVFRVFWGILRDLTDLSEFCGSATPRGYSIYPWVGRCSAAPHILTLFKTNIADFPTLFKTEFRFLIHCLRHLINIRACKFCCLSSKKRYPV